MKLSVRSTIIYGVFVAVGAAALCWDVLWMLGVDEWARIVGMLATSGYVLTRTYVNESELDLLRETQNAASRGREV